MRGKIMSGLDELKYLLYGEQKDEYGRVNFPQRLEIAKKLSNQIKALEIIKETFRLSFDDEELTIGVDNVYFLKFKNKEKYELLKEVFEWNNF